ncbi:MAG: FAD-dependent oxidoreductase [Mycobacterium sp.]
MTPHQVVIVGYGLAGARLQEELYRHDPTQRRVRSAVYGKEHIASYNRIQLPNVLAGRLRARDIYLRPPGWCEENGLRTHLGVRVTHIDRANHVIGCADGNTCHYDTLVIATGSRPHIPIIDGARDEAGELIAGVVPFRTLHDCQMIATRVHPGARVVVLGGGLLGLEAARAANLLGAQVTVVHPKGFPMERQMDTMGGFVLTRVLREMGLTMVFGRRVTQIMGTSARSNTVALDDGETLPADVVILTAGIRPECTLAEQAGLSIDNAIVIDDNLTTSDPDIRAIGECVEHRGRVYGLVQPGWHMAEVLAKQLTGADPQARYTGTREVTRLKAHGIDLLSMGDVAVPQHDPRDEILTIADPTRGRYGKIVVRDDRLTGAITLGCPTVTGILSQLFDSQTPVPTDRMSLLLGTSQQQGSPHPEDLPDTSVICRCNTVTKKQIVDAWSQGHRTVPEIVEKTRATTGCGGCSDTVHALCTSLRASMPHAADTRMTA